MHYLTNWIPETVHFDDVSNKENLWHRLLQNFRDQNIIMCLQKQNKNGNLDYFAVIDLIESHDIKILQCKSAFHNQKNVKQFLNNLDELPIHFKVYFIS